MKGNYVMKYKGYTMAIIPSKYGGFGLAFKNKILWEHKGDKKLTFEKVKILAFELLDESIFFKKRKIKFTLFFSFYIHKLCFDLTF